MEWKIVTYPRVRNNTYLVSENGDIYSSLTKRVRHCKSRNSSGYCHTSFQTDDDNNPTIYVCIHRIVAWEFCKGYSETKTDVNHKDGIKHNNHYSNLEWCTPLENINHAKYVIKTYRAPDRSKLGKRGPRPQSYGEKNSNVKYSEFTIREICHLIEQGKSNIDILKSFNNDSYKENKSLYHLIRGVRLKQTWKHISEEYDF